MVKLDYYATDFVPLLKLNNTYHYMIMYTNVSQNTTYFYKLGLTMKGFILEYCHNK